MITLLLPSTEFHLPTSVLFYQMNVLKTQHLKLPFASNIVFFLHCILFKQNRLPLSRDQGSVKILPARWINVHACLCSVQPKEDKGHALINQKIKWQRLRGGWCLGPWSTTQNIHFYTIWCCSSVNWYIGWTLYLQITIKFIDWAIPVKARWLSVDHPLD